MLRIQTHGEPFERGKQQGEATRTLTLPWIEQLLDKLYQRYKSEFHQQVDPQVRAWRQQLEVLYPEGAGECCGLAAGLGIDETTYFTLAFYHRLGGHLPQCTAIGTRDRAGRPLLGKSDDIEPEDLGMNILEITAPATGYRHLHFHFGGTIWTVAGINECGLAMGMTGIPGPLLESEGLFSLDALHTILPACADIEEALAHIRALRLNAYGFSLVLGDAQGGLALVEKTGAGTALIPPASGVLVHTNHILDADFAAQNPQQSEPIRSNGQRRLANAHRLLQTSTSPDLVLSNRADSGPICQRGEDGLHTDFAVVFSPVEKLVHLWAGYPDEVEKESLPLDNL